jgi:AcrR family transcriptional regulator
MRRSPAAERLLDSAMRLFAQQGYAATSVGEIQVAAGLTHGSGALYKHFPSKQTLLEAGIARLVEQSASERDALQCLPTDPLKPGLAAIADAVLSAPSMNADMLRIVYRELDAFPHLRDEVLADRLQAAFAGVARWLRCATEQQDAHVDDPVAAAAVLVGGLMFFRLLEALLGDRPGGVDPERFAAAWADLAARAIAVAIPALDPVSGPTPPTTDSVSEPTSLAADPAGGRTPPAAQPAGGPIPPASERSTPCSTPKPSTSTRSRAKSGGS